MNKWFEKKLGLGLGTEKIYLLKKMSIPDKTRGMNSVDFVEYDTKCKEKGITYEEVDEMTEDLKSKSFVQKASLIASNVTTTREGDNLLRNRKIVFIYLPLNLLIVAPLIYLANHFSQNLILFIIIGLVLANIHPIFNNLIGYFKRFTR